MKQHRERHFSRSLSTSLPANRELLSLEDRFAFFAEGILPLQIIGAVMHLPFPESARRYFESRRAMPD
jgi:hypothetical protein